ncbi:MAG TPA: hypothetical protein VIM11_25625 [Tepidisphaeraceae bacterium]|jgi:PBP1b-binding outer membrane lipoprotein LpoB
MNAAKLLTRVSAIIALAVLPMGCSSSPESSASSQPATGFLAALAPVHKTGAQIWAENCTRCHNPRPATQYSPQQWDVITSHMRVRCNLDGEEQREVWKFMSGV